MDNRDKMLEWVNRRLKEAEAQIFASPEFQFLRARSAHLIWSHGSGEVCTCPEWNPEPKHKQG